VARPDNSTLQNLAADGSQGGTSVTVSNATALSAGQFVMLDEHMGASWKPVPADFGCSNNITPTPCPPQVWQGDDRHGNTALGRQQFQTIITTPMRPARTMFRTPGVLPAAMTCFPERPADHEIKEVASVSGNTITFTPALDRISHEPVGPADALHHVECPGHQCRRVSLSIVCAPMANCALRARLLVGEEHRGERSGRRRQSRINTLPSMRLVVTSYLHTDPGLRPAAPVTSSASRRFIEV